MEWPWRLRDTQLGGIKSRMHQLCTSSWIYLDIWILPWCHMNANGCLRHSVLFTCCNPWISAIGDIILSSRMTVAFLSLSRAYIRGRDTHLHTECIPSVVLSKEVATMHCEASTWNRPSFMLALCRVLENTEAIIFVEITYSLKRTISYYETLGSHGRVTVCDGKAQGFCAEISWQLVE